MKTSTVDDGYYVGDQIEVVVWVNSENYLSSAVDVWGTVDGTVLKIVGISEIDTDDAAFNFDMVANTNYQSTNNFQVSCVSADGELAGGETTLDGRLVLLTLEAKTAGTGKVSFTCNTNSNGINSTTDSNIFDTDVVDRIDCAATHQGELTITVNSDGTSTSVLTPTPTLSTTTTIGETDPETGLEVTTTPASAGTTLTTTGETTTTTKITSTTTKVTGVAGSTSQNSELPRTGASGPTIGLIIFGAVSILSAVFLKFL
ncbi:MAG: hypothetical protein PHT07_24825 [Paludibacter sp.]|nr:hypothetical protein [Paludibacter sp.]